jgi:hypothetical protein
MHSKTPRRCSLLRKKIWTSKNGFLRGYRSGLEEKIATQIKSKGLKVEYESTKITYSIPESKHKYTPDFILPNGIIIESKGRFLPQDRKKHLLIKAQHPELDIRFVFTNSRAKIRKGSKTSYGAWCEKYGFKYADKLIPDAWFNETMKS